MVGTGMSQGSDTVDGVTDDWAFLRNSVRPSYELGPDPLGVVDLFCGCGGMTLGLAEAARRAGRSVDVVLAVDHDEAIAKVFAANFPKARVESSDVAALFDGELGGPITPTEREWREKLGTNGKSPLILQGGPPCQGHSDLNNHTRRSDPRNGFYDRMARAAEVLLPSVVVIENVPPVRNDSGRVVDRASLALEASGYRVADRVVSFHDMGVPQRRKRHTVLAVRDLSLDPREVLDALGGKSEKRDLEWAIRDLVGVTSSSLDVPSRVTAPNQDRIDWLFSGQDRFDLPNHLRPPCHRGAHSYVSMYGRLAWDEPAQTITSGYGSMGQGRYVHPSERRTLTPHEAARIQFFPDWFDFTADGLEMRRTTWATMIGNAVPPKLMMELGRMILPHLGP